MAGRAEDAEGHLLLLGLRHVDHGQGGGRKAEHQDRVEAGGQQSCGRVAGREPGELTGDDIAARRLVVAVDEPDVGVQDVVQPDRDQHPVREAIGERAESPCATDELTNRGEAGIEDRVEVAQRRSP